jgi:hypothetical protein
MYRGVKTLHARLDIAAGGALGTTSVSLGGAATPFTLESAGVYRFYPNEAVVGPAFPSLQLQKATAEDLFLEVKDNQLTAATPYIEVRLTDAAGAVNAPTNACSVYFRLDLVDSGGNP